MQREPRMVSRHVRRRHHDVAVRFPPDDITARRELVLPAAAVGKRHRKGKVRGHGGAGLTEFDARRKQSTRTDQMTISGTTNGARYSRVISFAAAGILLSISRETLERGEQIGRAHV